MDKINSIGISNSQFQLLQEMRNIASLSGSQMTSISDAVSSLNTTGNQVSFSQVLKQAVNSVNHQQQVARQQQTAVDMGVSDNLMGAMLESQKASISFSAMVEVRNKLSSALDQIMNISL